MERLTKRTPNGRVGFVGNGSPTENAFMIPNVLNRLATYEDTGLEPEGIQSMVKFFDCMNHITPTMTVKRLMDIFSAEREGRLVVLPCGIGDILYITEPRFYNYVMHDGIQKGVCKGYEMHARYGWIVKVELEEGEPHSLYFYNFSKFGKTVFTTKEEAEAELEKMKGEQNGSIDL